MAAPFRKGLRKRPSDASRWTRCAKSLSFTKHYPNESSVAADEGTAAHLVREWCLDVGFEPYDFIGTQINVNGALYECDIDMADALQPGIDEIREFDGEVFVETWVDTTEWVGLDEDGKPQGGTVDCGVIGTELIVLSDLKFGRGVAVPAVKNDQQMLYALGLYHQVAKHISKAKQFLIIIDQPRNSAGGGYWSVTLDELEAYGRFVKNRAKLCDSDDAEFTPGESQCKWCPAANLEGRIGGCPAHNEDMMELVGLEFDDLDAEEAWEPPVVEEMTFERLIQIEDKASAIKKWLGWIHGRSLQHLLDEGPTAGKKAVLGRKPNRKWLDGNLAEAFIKQNVSDAFNKKLKSPSQVEKEIGKKYKVPVALLEDSEAKPVIVDEADERDSITALADDFDDYGNDSENDEVSDFEDFGEI